MASGTFGKQSEDFIALYLQKLGFKILEQNYKKFFGEIDIIAKKNDLVVFVEVKARKNSQISIEIVIIYNMTTNIDYVTLEQKLIQTKQVIDSEKVDNL